ncbi:MAG: hypothetical protein L6V35_09035 [Alistipes putredinis]|nr:MAG: hypothetical protein L6V35_09035 [Alistipes putredinis]
MVKIKDSLRKFFGQLISPVFVTLLFASLTLWYVSKLGYTYTTEMPVNINIDGQRLKVTCLVEGRGTALWGQRMSLRNKINIKSSELKTRPSDNPPYVIIDSASLGKVLSLKAGSGDF